MIAWRAAGLLICSRAAAARLQQFDSSAQIPSWRFDGSLIGVDKHVDPGIRELSGARRDATALHALFADSISPMDMQSRLIVDEQATQQAVADALDATLGRR